MGGTNALREARDRIRMTQAHLAAAAGVSERTVIRAEQGKPVSAESERALCAVLGLHLSALAGRKPGLPSSTPADCIAAMGETVEWEARPGLAAWRAANAFRAWAALAAVLAGACTCAIAMAATAAFETPSVLPRALALSTAGIAAMGYLAHRARRYAALDREVSDTTYAMTGHALWTVRQGRDGTRSMVRRELAPAGAAVAPRPAYGLWPRVRDVVVDMPGGPVRLHGVVSVDAAKRA